MKELALLPRESAGDIGQAQIRASPCTPSLKMSVNVPVRVLFQHYLHGLMTLDKPLYELLSTAYVQLS